MKMLKYISLSLVMALLFSLTNNVKASNVRITNIAQVAVDASNHRIEFDLEWDDSWRRDNNEPGNYDGVWLFIKYRDCLEKATGNPENYQHAWLSTDTADHTMATSTLDGSPVVLHKEMGLTNIGGTDRAMGVFIHQPPGDRIGDVAATTVSLLWRPDLQGEDPTIKTYDIQVFAVEMVYVPTEAFYVGDGASDHSMRDLSVNEPVYIDGASLDMSISGGDNNLIEKSSATPNVPNAYPNGYEGFWIMKYEISQQQYMQFVNTLRRTNQNNRFETNITGATSSVTEVYVMSNSNSIVSRNGIVCEGNIPVGGEPLELHMNFNGNITYDEPGDGKDIACNFLSAYDLLAYLDWAALRPLTGFEYEKAARGPNKRPFGRTYPKAWGLTSFLIANGITNSGQATEAATNSGEGLCNFGDHPSVRGPMRCGFAATATSSRFQAGASYYGVFELSGNVAEAYMEGWGNNPSYYANFTGRSGDGLLNPDGESNQPGWPRGINGTDNGTNFMIYRGGSWEDPDPGNDRFNEMNISHRVNRTSGAARNDQYGGRGGRYVHK